MVSPYSTSLEDFAVSAEKIDPAVSDMCEDMQRACYIITTVSSKSRRHKVGGGDLSIHQLQLLEKVYFVARTSITLARQKLEAAAAAAATAADKEGIQSHVAFLDHLLNEEINLYAIMDKSAARSLGLVHLNMFRGQANPPYDIRAKDRGEAACALVDATKEIMKGIERVSYAVLALMVVAMAFELCRDGGRRGADRSAVAGALVSAAHLLFDHKVALLVVLSTIWVSGARLRPRR